VSFGNQKFNGGKCYDFSSELLVNQMSMPRKGRLTQPLIRHNGGHRPATWEEALDRVVTGFRRSIEKKDPRDFGMFSCSKTTNELNYIAQKFVRSVMGTNNIDSCNRT
jgi:formate dehydrogenase (hydrogenase)